ncbi:mitochondrial carrier domain-containing protein [Catenaria anguillulae PL171]|uniref:Mitochondrial carrier domain-containing protein n=1 Tax=Catenaria anguillulae PL171 TaxID=765915 RepID=A0A1Y2HAY4_9FUNG|nr:mitochondrial carrier domain-containing protein [Catenaria anguillulae PL171]
MTTQQQSPSPSPSPIPIPKPKPKSSFFQSQATDHAVSGFLGGALSTLLLHPLDLVKTRFQADAHSKPRLSLSYTARSLAHIARTSPLGPIRGIYQGLSPNFAGATLSWGLYFWWYSQLKQHMVDDPTSTSQIRLSPQQHLGAAALAGALTSLLTNPIWLVKTRMCLQPADAPIYRGLAHALATIARHEGLRGLYRGLTPALFGVSHGAIQFMVYEELKHACAGYRNTHPHAHWNKTAEYMATAIVSKTVAAVTTYPYQVVISGIWRREGIRGMYKGLGANILRVMPGTCVTFVVYEWSSAFFKAHARY